MFVNAVSTSHAPTLPGPRASGRTAEVDRAILRTVLYASLFQAPLTVSQLHRALMDVGVDRIEIRSRLRRAFLRERLEMAGEHVYLRGREACLDLHHERRRHTSALLDAHRRLLRAAARFPFVRLLALSGACAHDNATHSDVDLFVVARRGRAWSVFLGLTLLGAVLGGRRAVRVNYVVDEDGLALPERDLFTAAEIVGMRPLAGGEAYCSFLEANAWVAARHPNFFAAHQREPPNLPEAGARRWIERALDLGPAPLVEAFSRLLLGAYLRRKARGRSGVVLAAGCLKLHTQDHAPHLNATFAHRLAALEERPGPSS
jgi:hypothetical protein